MPTPLPPSGPSVGDTAAINVANEAASASSGPSVDDTAARSKRTDKPDWASLEFDVDKWWEVLDTYEIDVTARKNLFLLAQLGDRGRLEALELVCKLQHKGHAMQLSSPSKWLHSSCCKTRERLTKSLGMWVDPITDYHDARGGVDDRSYNKRGWDDSRGDSWDGSRGDSRWRYDSAWDDDSRGDSWDGSRGDSWGNSWDDERKRHKHR